MLEMVILLHLRNPENQTQLNKLTLKSSIYYAFKHCYKTSLGKEVHAWYGCVLEMRGGKNRENEHTFNSMYLAAPTLWLFSL